MSSSRSDVELGAAVKSELPPIDGVGAARGGYSIGGYHLTDVGTSCVLPTPVFALWRVAVAIFLWTMLIIDCIKTGSYAVVTLTVWSLLTESLVFTLLAAASIICVLRSIDIESDRRSQAPANVLAILYQTSASATVFLDFIVWTLLLDSIGNFRNVTNHVLNIILIFIDVALSSTVFRYINVVFFVALAAGYILFTWIRHAVTDNFPYPFLDAWDAVTGEAIPRRNVVWTYVTIVLWAFGAGVLTVLFSRAKKFYSSKLRAAPMLL